MLIMIRRIILEQRIMFFCGGASTPDQLSYTALFFTHVPLTKLVRAARDLSNAKNATRCNDMCFGHEINIVWNGNGTRTITRNVDVDNSGFWI